MSAKQTAVNEWRVVLTSRRDGLARSTDAAKSSTRVDGTHRPSNRGERAAVTSAGYLAHGLAARAAALEAHLEHIDGMGTDPRDEVAVGALLTLTFDDGPDVFIALFPGGDATELPCGVQVLSIQSPLARQLQGAEVGDVLEIERGGRIAAVELKSIC